MPYLDNWTELDWMTDPMEIMRRTQFALPSDLLDAPAPNVNDLGGQLLQKLQSISGAAPQQAAEALIRTEPGAALAGGASQAPAPSSPGPAAPSFLTPGEAPKLRLDVPLPVSSLNGGRSVAGPIGLDMPTLPSDVAFDTMEQTAAAAGSPFTSAATQTAGEAAKAAPGVMARAGNTLKSPLGIAGTLASLAMTDWEDPESIGSSLGGIGGGALGGAIAGGGAAAGGAAAGATAGSVVPVVGTAIGAALGSLGGKALGGLFGDDEEEEQKKREREMHLQALMDNMRNTGDYLQRRNQAVFERYV
jgi:hypothetical protein